jgi:hypothetical protein
MNEKKTSTLLSIHYYIMNILDFCAPHVTSILNLLNANDECFNWKAHWGRNFTEAEVIDALYLLIEHGCVKQRVYDPVKRRSVTAPPGTEIKVKPATF